jgi:phosphoribosyl-dephospho-CoA transferase
MLARHNLVFLSQAGWGAASHGRPEPEQTAMQRWHDNAWPAVVRRAEGGDGGAADSEKMASLALSLPPDPVNGNKSRVGFRVATRHVLRVVAPVTLTHALPAAPGAWQADLRALDAAATSIGLRFHVFGSLAWQAITGWQYVGPRSDIDLLWYPSRRHELEAGLRLLSRHAAALPLDGEIIFPDGSGVAWKEWLQEESEGAPTFASTYESAHEAHGQHANPIALQASRVLAKSSQSVRLVACADLIASLGEVACPG